jgi:hypothetical protein
LVDSRARELEGFLYTGGQDGAGVERAIARTPAEPTQVGGIQPDPHPNRALSRRLAHQREVVSLHPNRTMSTTTTTTSTTASAYAEGAIPAILVRGEGPTDAVAAVAAHEARTQDFTPATRPDGLRADREYPVQFDVENPGR